MNAELTEKYCRQKCYFETCNLSGIFIKSDNLFSHATVDLKIV